MHSLLRCWIAWTIDSLLDSARDAALARIKLASDGSIFGERTSDLLADLADVSFGYRGSAFQSTFAGTIASNLRLNCLPMAPSELMTLGFCKHC